RTCCRSMRRTFTKKRLTALTTNTIRQRSAAAARTAKRRRTAWRGARSSKNTRRAKTASGTRRRRVTKFPELDTTAVDAARRLLGCELEREIGGQAVRVRIVETEAYDQTDAASHSYKGRTPRTDIM